MFESGAIYVVLNNFPKISRVMKNMSHKKYIIVLLQSFQKTQPCIKSCKNVNNDTFSHFFMGGPPTAYTLVDALQRGGVNTDPLQSENSLSQE